VLVWNSGVRKKNCFRLLQEIYEQYFELLGPTENCSFNTSSPLITGTIKRVRVALRLRSGGPGAAARGGAGEEEGGG
jgi:hypothetical protein